MMERFKKVLTSGQYFEVIDLKKVGETLAGETMYLLTLEGLQEQIPALVKGQAGDIGVAFPRDWQGYLPESVEEVEQVDWEPAQVRQDDDGEYYLEF